MKGGKDVLKIGLIMQQCEIIFLRRMINMKRNLFIMMLLVLSLCLMPAGHGQAESDFKILQAEVVTIHPGEPDTMTVKVKGKYSWEEEREEGITIDPNYCKFYKDDDKPKAIGIVKPGDNIEVTYVISEGVMVAFNVVVMPKPEVDIE
jgi:hypothetical protein